LNKIVITKRVAKQGRNNVIIIPSYLKALVKAGSIVKVEIQQICEADENGKTNL
jgi:hypothetical protein